MRDVILAFALLTTPAWAQSPTEGEPTPAEPTPAPPADAGDAEDEGFNLSDRLIKAPIVHDFALTVSPLHLIVPMLELTGELRLGEDFGVAAVLGFGRLSDEVTRADGTLEDERLTIYEGGAQLRYYLLGNFEQGLQIGVEGLYVYVDRDEDETLDASAEGLTVGGFLGYKYTAGGGFTAEAQVGMGYLVVDGRGEASGETTRESDEDTVPLLNINLGWSF